MSRFHSLPSLLYAAAIIFSLVRLDAQTAYETILTFPANAPGAWAPASRLVEVNGPGPEQYLYGTTRRGGSNDLGTIFRVSNNGQFFTQLWSFNGTTNGANPSGGLMKAQDGNLYGTTVSGGSGGASNYGMIFRITPNGGFTSLFTFRGTNGSYPHSPLTQMADGNLYGTTYYDGGSTVTGWGTVFKFATNGTLTKLHTFNGTNGAAPRSRLVPGLDGHLYGTTTGGPLPTGESVSSGTLFRISTNGILTTLVVFNGTNGSFPAGDIALDRDGNIYGVTHTGGAFDMGTLYCLSTNSVFTTLVHFDGTNGSGPYGGVLLTRDGNLYGSTAFTGDPGEPPAFGTLFMRSAKGDFSTIVRFDGTNGRHPFPDFIQASNGFIYGANNDAYLDHTLNGGTLFKITEPPVITSISASNNAVTLKWPSWPNRLYFLEQKTSETNSNWTMLGSWIPSGGAMTTQTVSSAGELQRLYRVGLWP